MDPILRDWRGKTNLVVIEDACQAHGAFTKTKRPDPSGAAGCFSFYPGKNLGACGEGGAVVTDDEEMRQKIRMIRDHGQEKKYFHRSKATTAAWTRFRPGAAHQARSACRTGTQARRTNAARYDRTPCRKSPASFGWRSPFAESVYHLYVILVENRDELQKFLQEKGIATGLHYPLPLHLQKAYAHLGYKKGDFPVAESAAERLLSLPMYPELTAEQIDYVCSSIKEFLK